MKRNITKILSILCLLAIIASTFLPWITLTGSYKEMLAGITASTQSVPEENYAVMEQMLATQGIEINFKECFGALNTLADPLMDGKVSIMDFVELSKNAAGVSEALSGLPVDGLGISTDESDPLTQTMGQVSEMISSMAALGQLMGMLSAIFLVPVALFGLLAFAIVVRILLRLFNRRGLGVLITLLTIFNSAFMVGLSSLISYVASEELPIGAEYTNVPFIVIACSILSCILWAIGRGAKEKGVKEETPVAPAAPVAQPAPAIEEPVVEAASAAEEAVVEETSTEEVVEETLIDTELVEEVVEETSEEENV